MFFIVILLIIVYICSSGGLDIIKEMAKEDLRTQLSIPTVEV